jgi:multiple sugar transport system permease protein
MSKSVITADNPMEIRSKREKFSKMRTREAIWAYIFIAPVVLGLAAFYSLPSLISLGFSFTQWDGISDPSFVGLDNFTALWDDEKYIRSMINTFLYTAGVVPCSIAIATVVAVLLNKSIKGRVIYRTVYFIPVITMPIAVGMVWKWLYNSEFGLINIVLGAFHLPGPNWLFDEKYALLSIVLVSIWSSIGYNVVILLSGLQGISSSYYEASSLDGATGFKQFWHITLPMLTPSLFFVLVISLINALQVFDLIYIMMGKVDSMLGVTRTTVYSIWENGFKYFNMGYASAQAWVLFIIILIITIIQLYLQKKWVHYE